MSSTMESMKHQTRLEKKFRQKLFKQVGAYLAMKRQDAGLKQADISMLSQYSPQFISNIECGTAFPPPPLMAKMIEAYHLSEDDFLGTLMGYQLQYYREVYFEAVQKKPSRVSTLKGSA